MSRLVFVFLVPAALWAQDVFQASGETVDFALKAGAKASWQQSSVVAVPAVKVRPVIRAAVAGNRLHISGGLPGVLRLYRLDGREAGSWKVDGSGNVTLGTALSNNVYLLRFESKGYRTITLRLAVVRERGRS